MSTPNPSQQPPESRTTTIIRAVLFAVVLLATTASIIGLKQLTGDGPLTPEGLASRDSIRHIARPDTTEAPGTVPEQPAATNSSSDAAPADSITVDERSPIDAGYEDGYYAGISDGVLGEERASFDDTSQFPTREQRQSYTDAYHRGYAQGYKDGLEGKQFGVVPQGEEEEDDELEIEEIKQ